MVADLLDARANMRRQVIAELGHRALNDPPFDLLDSGSRPVELRVELQHARRQVFGGASLSRMQPRMESGGQSDERSHVSSSSACRSGGKTGYQ